LVVLAWGLVGEGLVGSAGVVVVDPGSEFESGVFDGGEAIAPAKLFLEGLDEALAEAVLLRRVGSDVFLLEAVVPDDGAVLARAEGQTVVMAQEHAGRISRVQQSMTGTKTHQPSFPQWMRARSVAHL